MSCQTSVSHTSVDILFVAKLTGTGPPPEAALPELCPPEKRKAGSIKPIKANTKNRFIKLLPL
jgi:hypothetical protein